MPPVFSQHSFELISRSSEQTRRVGMRLGALLQPGDVVGLVGDLGAGKTTMMQGVASGWGSSDPVSSPTFVLVNMYRRPDQQRFYHLDAYRLRGASDAVDLDLESMFEEGPLVIEWADRIEAVLPEERIWVELEWLDETRRQLVFSARGEHCQKLLRRFRNQVFGVA
ncbi:MAG: tRNA (adenosine(37)-N6)-threonylcarbamoyltransferase complex ATPase subunit type 1 TsaE [Anaerolineae bacterium]|nr:tRNA (adenosine(37)-N6)-threonylcarbamoyltransferase complex ATPase subunit type 1 TsaE [Anaerolineae bacterium]MBL6965211.1 tRNA (adenosine(37)-N6)-threonylcarbamoyltransferase complex ATPase subunit type 1 TsaE [Anaerolineales bacterium]